jgi:hypothetical protein
MQDAYDELVERLRVRWAAFAVGEEQVGRPDERVRSVGMSTEPATRPSACSAAR